MSVGSDQMRILIIDDNPSLVNVFAKILEIKGFSVTAETTFKKGLDHLQKNQFQAAFIDAPLDEYDEKKILTVLFENKIFTKTAIFLFSSIEFDDSELIHWKNNGLYSYLKKPIRRSKILQELESVNLNFKRNISTPPPADEPENQDATPEQFEKLSHLEKQIHELETKQSSDNRESISEEITDDAPSTSTPPPADEPENQDATPEQFEKLSHLEKQIHELETKQSSDNRESISEEITDDAPSTSTPPPADEPENQDATPEQFEKLSHLEKQIHELETKQSSDNRESISEEITDDAPSTSTPPPADEPENQDATPEQFEKLSHLEKQIHELESTQTFESKPISGKLLLQNVIEGLKSSKIQSMFSKSPNRDDDTSSLNAKKTIQKEIQKTLSDLSVLKKEIQSFDVEESDKSDIDSKRKLKKSATPTKRKLKKSATPTKRKLKKSATPTKRKLKKSATPTKRKLKKSATPTKRKLKKSATPTKRKLKKSATPTKRKLKKSATPTKRKLKKSTTPTKRKLKKSTTPTKRKLKKSTTPTKRKLKKKLYSKQ